MTIKRIFNWLIGLPVAVIGIGFAVANRQWITVSFDPFDRDQPFAFINMPLWALLSPASSSASSSAGGPPGAAARNTARPRATPASNSSVHRECTRP